MKIATFVKNLEGWRGDARLYRVDPPMNGDDGETFEYVIVSDVVAFDTNRPETLIFGCNKDEETDYCDLKGSFRGDIDHNQALRNAGYVIE